MKVLRLLFVFFAACAMLSCDMLSDTDNGQENEQEQDQVDGPEEDVVHKGADLEFQASGIVDENLLALCINMTHERKYDISGLEDCSWARVRYAQNVDGHDWMPYITVDPNDTGAERRVGIVIIYEKNEVCRHTIVQHP